MVIFNRDIEAAKTVAKNLKSFEIDKFTKYIISVYYKYTFLYSIYGLYLPNKAPLSMIKIPDRPDRPLIEEPITLNLESISQEAVG